MKAFTIHEGTTVAMMEDNINTDQILPSRFLSRIEKTGFGQFLFANWRYIQDEGPNYGKENPEFIMNKPERRHASILIAGDNFAGGSSREHAVWALDDWGIRCVIAGGFSDIFFNNSFKNGLLAITLPLEAREELASLRGDETIIVNLEEQLIISPQATYSFDVDNEVKYKLLHGIDDITETMTHEASIKYYEEQWNSFYEPNYKLSSEAFEFIKSKITD